jgi:hypothetical protein
MTQAPGDLLCIARRPNPRRADAIPKKLSLMDKVSREATACPGKCKATLSHNMIQGILKLLSCPKGVPISQVLLYREY